MRSDAHIGKILAQGFDVFETQHRHKDGHEIDIEVSATLMRDTQQIVAFCRDISARKAQRRSIACGSCRFRDA